MTLVLLEWLTMNGTTPLLDDISLKSLTCCMLSTESKSFKSTSSLIKYKHCFVEYNLIKSSFSSTQKGSCVSVSIIEVRLAAEVVLVISEAGLYRGYLLFVMINLLNLLRSMFCTCSTMGALICINIPFKL
eukprot:NODE_282_length_11867_cov_0.266995.p4 type:complete len:131 gc:universal NODE_282_length_11867_cov_0.266995:5369-4977(-)